MLSAQAPARAPAEGPALAPEPCAGRTFLPGLALPPGRASFPLCPSVRQGQRMLCHATCFPRALRNTVCSENALGKLGEGACGSEDARRARSRPERAGPARHLLAASREGRVAGGTRPLLGAHACVTEPATTSWSRNVPTRRVWTPGAARPPDSSSIWALAGLDGGPRTPACPLPGRSAGVTWG